MRVGCVIMASGSSTRFGGEKLVAPFLGEPLIWHALSALPKALARAVVVTRSEDVRAVAARCGVPCVLHREPHRCDTVRIGLSEMAGMDGCLFLVGDQPLCSAATMEAMIELFRRQPDRIIRACHLGTMGNPVLFPASLFPELSALQPGQTGGAVLRRHSGLVLPLEVDNPLELEDVDTPMGLSALESLALAQRQRRAPSH